MKTESFAKAPKNSRLILKVGRKCLQTSGDVLDLLRSKDYCKDRTMRHLHPFVKDKTNSTGCL